MSIRAKYPFVLLSVAVLAGCSDLQQKDIPEYGPANGTLMIVGGAATEDLYQQFIELAGGPEESRIIVVPTARGNRNREGELRVYTDSVVTDSWKKRGVKNVKMLHTSDPAVANTEEFVSDLRQATAVWFNGGRQWNIVDSYLNTLTYDEFHKVLERGGVIGGSSAGATIQGSFLARGAVELNTIMIAPEEKHRIGFSFLKNSAIDQHIDRRNRWTDLYEIIKVYPELLGIGISEATAIIVKGDVFEVIGRSKVAVHDAMKPIAFGDTTANIQVLSAGDIFDIKTRTLLYRAPQDSANGFPGK